MLKGRRLSRTGFPEDWTAILNDRVPIVAALPEQDLLELKRKILVFLEEKRFAGCSGLEITDEIRVVVAAQACLMILHNSSACYPGVSSVLVYPDTFYAKDMQGSTDGLAVDGLSYRRDYVILAWNAARRDSANPRDGSNLVLHEFAHQFDIADDSFDGVPLLPDKHLYDIWKHVFKKEFRALNQALERGEIPFLNDYAAENMAEFFAVASECFFERPRELSAAHPKIYSLMCIFYKIDLLRDSSAKTLKYSRADWPKELSDPDLELLGAAQSSTEQAERLLKGMVIFGALAAAAIIVCSLFIPITSAGASMYFATSLLLGKIVYDATRKGA